MTFTTYRSIANPVTESARSQWVAQEISANVVEAAIEGLAGLLQPDFSPPVVRRGDVLGIPRPVEFAGCRIDIVGVQETSPLSATIRRDIADRSREALTLCVLPSTALEIVGPFDTPSADVMTGALAIYPRDVDALAAGEVSFSDLVEYKFHRRLVADRPDAETQFAARRFGVHGALDEGTGFRTRALADAVTARGETLQDWLEHPVLVETDDLCARGRNVLLIGYSSSGKSVLAFQVGAARQAAGWRVHYVNLGETSGARGIASRLLFMDEEGSDGVPRPQPTLFILDDLQSEPSIARLALALASLSHRAHTGTRPIFLGVSWKEFAREAAEWCPDIAPIAVHAYVIRQRLIAKYSEEIEDKRAVEALEREIGDDIYLLRLALEITKREQARPTRGQVAEDVLRARLPVGVSDEARRVALLAGAIGQFDIHVRPDFLRSTASVDRRVLSDLIDSRLLRRVGDNVTLGHRSLCALIAWWIGEDGGWAELAALGGPANVAEAVLAYLRASGTAASIEALRALVARGGFKERDALSARAVALMDLWHAFDAVVERVEQQQHADPTWGRTPSSSVFVTTLLAEIGKPELALPSLDFLRAHWNLRDGVLEITTTDLATVVDFNLLRDAIIEEDENSQTPAGADQGVDIDIDRFHKTWLAGLILGAEAAASDSPIGRDSLASAVEALQITESGAFYPPRVPWCTARVLLGLAACGRSINTSEVARRAADWLLRDRTDGGAATQGMWVSGTGRWNTPIETTALSLLAVTKAGVDPADARLRPAREYLLSQRERWAGFEGAVTIEALLASGTPWEEVSSDAARVSAWALDQSLWQRATLPADEILAQTCHVAQAATHLVEIGWTAIKSDLPALLDAIDLAQSAPPSSDELARELGESSKAALSEREDLELPDVAQQRIGADEILALADLELDKYRIVGQYYRFDERAREVLRLRNDEIIGGLNSRDQLRKNFLIWAPPGSGKSFFIQQIASSLGETFVTSNYHPLNLAESSRESFTADLERIKQLTGVALCVIDEADARSAESWPYEEIFPMLDLNLVDADNTFVFVLIGSSGRGINALEHSIAERPKGKDLLDRIPSASRFELPPVRDEDRLIVFLTQAVLAANAKAQPIREVERLALYYLLERADLASPRQCTEFAKAAVSRMDADDYRLRFRHLFHVNDPAPMGFFADHVAIASLLQGVFVRISDSRLR